MLARSRGSGARFEKSLARSRGSGARASRLLARSRGSGARVSRRVSRLLARSRGSGAVVSRLLAHSLVRLLHLQTSLALRTSGSQPFPPPGHPLSSDRKMAGGWGGRVMLGPRSDFLPVSEFGTCYNQPGPPQKRGPMMLAT